MSKMGIRLEAYLVVDADFVLDQEAYAEGGLELVAELFAEDPAGFLEEAGLKWSDLVVSTAAYDSIKRRDRVLPRRAASPEPSEPEEGKAS